MHFANCVRPMQKVFQSVSVCMVMVLATPAVGAHPVIPLPGDMDRNNVVDSDDVHGFVTALTGGSDPCLIAAADVDFDATLDMADVELFVQFLVGDVSPEQGAAHPRSFSIGPVSGLTTSWHPAPTASNMPLGTTVQFELSGLQTGDSVAWNGATEVASGATFSRAEAIFSQTGEHLVEAVLTDGLGCTSQAAMLCEVVDVTAANVSYSVSISVPPFPVEPGSLTDRTMKYFFPLEESIARITPSPTFAYRTSIQTEVTFRAATQPIGFEPLVEWRRDNVVIWLGEALVVPGIDAPETHSFLVGPAGQGPTVPLVIYRATITSHTTGVDTIRDGEPATFTAVTDPPGHEDNIRWLSTTWHGTAKPATGTGGTFVVTFGDSFGPVDVPPAGYQWLGVRADNAVYIQERDGCYPQCNEDFCEFCIEGQCIHSCNYHFCEVCNGDGECISMCDECSDCWGNGWCVSRCNSLEHCVNGECVPY